MFTLTSTRVLELHTPEEVIAKANEVKNMGGIEGERLIRISRELFIKAKILAQITRPFNWSVGYVPSLNLYRRVNGQTSTGVFLQLTADEWKMVRFPVVVVEELYTCDTAKDLATLFEQFDAAISSRSREDLVGVHLAVEEDFYGNVAPHAANKATQGLTWYLQKVEGYRGSSASEQFQLIHENDEIKTFMLFCGKDGLNLSRKLLDISMKPVIAAMYHTTRRGTDHDRAFWRHVSGGKQANIEEDGHEHKLAAFLEHARDETFDWKATKNLFKNKEYPDDIEIFSTCIRVFAAYKRNQRVAEAFVKVQERNAKRIVQLLYPLPSAA
jgi:hypothetical protein